MYFCLILMVSERKAECSSALKSGGERADGIWKEVQAQSAAEAAAPEDWV